MHDESQLMQEDEEYIHVGALIASYFRFLLHRWYIFLLVLLIPVGYVVATRNNDTYSWYTATVYYSLERTGDVYTDASVASRVAAGVNALTSTADFRAQMQEQMSSNVSSAAWTIEGTSVNSANLFHVTVYCKDKALTDELLAAFESVYPAWVNKTTGNTTLTIEDEVLDGGFTIRGTSFQKKLVYAVVIGLAVWFVLATIAILSVRKIFGEEDMLQVVSSSCLGILPEVKKKKRENSTRETLLLTESHLDGNFQQAMRSFAARVERGIAGKPKQVVMVTSTLRQEGKSLMVMNLALSLQHHGKQVAIIDGDLYQAGVCRIAQIDPDHSGLSDYLTSTGGARGIFTTWNKIIIVPPGTNRQVGMGIMNTERFQNLLGILKKYADVILIDTPPAGELGDAVIFSGMADQVVYVVRGNYAEVRDLRRGIEPFVQNHKLVGYVLNRCNNSVSSYGYGYGYGGYYSRYRNYSSYGYGYSSRYGYGSYGNLKNGESSEEQSNDW